MRARSPKTTVDNQLPLLSPPPATRAALCTCGLPSKLLSFLEAGRQASGICLLIAVAMASAVGLAQEAPSTNGCLGYFPFNGNGNEALSGRPSIVFGATLTADRLGNPDSAYLFPTSSIAYINLGPGLGTARDADQTITWWEKHSISAMSIMPYFSGYVSPTERWDFTERCDLPSDGLASRIVISSFDSSAGYAAVASEFKKSDGEWTHHAVLFRGTNSVDYYQDGALVSTGSGLQRVLGDLYLGVVAYSFPDPSAGETGGLAVLGAYRGALDEFRFYDRALSASEVNDVFLHGGPFLPQTISFPAMADVAFSTNAVPLSATASSGLPVSFRVVSGPGAIAGGSLTVSGTGIVSVAAEQHGSGKYRAAESGTNLFTVGQGSQWISFPSLPDATFSPNAGSIQLQATASSGLTVSFTLLSGPARLETSSLVLTGAGTVSVSATQAGDANYHPAEPASISFTVLKATQQITFAQLPDVVMTNATNSLTLQATVSSELPVSFSLVSGPATLHSNTLTFRGAGTVTVTANQAGDDNYLPAEQVTQSFSVTWPAVGSTAWYPFNGNATEAFSGRPSIVFGATLTADRFGNPDSAYLFSTSNVTYINLGPGLMRGGEVEETISWWQLSRSGGVALCGYNSPGSVWSLQTQPFILSSNFNVHGISMANAQVLSGYYRTPLLPIITNWAHYVLVAYGTNNLELYCNGHRLPMDDRIGTALRASGDLYLGTGVDVYPYPNAAGGLFASGFDGALDDVHIYNRALTPSEIEKLYLDEAQVTNAPPVAWDPSLPAFLTNGLIAYYPLDGQAWDLSGNGHHGTMLHVEMAPNRFGVDGKAVRFPADIDTAITIPGQFLPAGDDPMTITLWFRLENPTLPPGPGFSKYPVLDGQGDSYMDWNFHLILQGNGVDISPIVEVFDPSGVVGGVGTWSLFAAGENALAWHQLVISFRGKAESALFLDGHRVSWGQSGTGNHRNRAELLYLGWAPRNRCLGGSLDDVRFYNRSFTDAEAREQYAYESARH